MKISELETLLEMATTTGSIAIVPFGLVKSNTKEHGLEATRDRLKKASKKKGKKDKKVMDPNSFSPVVMEYDYSVASQEAAEIASEYKAKGYSMDEIIRKMAKVFDMSVIRRAVKEIR